MGLAGLLDARDAIQDLLYEISVGLESGDASEEELARWEESLLGLGATGYDEDGPPEGLEEIVRDLYERVRSARRRWWQFWRSTEPPSQSGR